MALNQYMQESHNNNNSNKKIRRRPFNYDIDKDYGPAQYLVWNIIKEVNSEQQWLEVQDGMITVNVKEYEVKITNSLPDGESN